MSFSREGWKSQKLLAQVCRQCLSKRIVTTSTPVFMRRLATTITQPIETISLKCNKTPGLLEKFRKELYQPTHDPALHYSARVKKTITRRQGRQRLLNMYQLMKKQNPLFISQLSQQELELFISKFMTNPDDPSSNGPCMEAFEILQDLKSANYFDFKREEYELMIYLATELKLTKKAMDLLTEASTKFTVNSTCYEAVIGLLSTQKKQAKKMDYWLNQFQSLGLEPTKIMVRSIVLSRVGSNQLEEAALFLRHHHPTNDLSDLVVKYADSRELLDHALNIFAMDCLNDWRLNEMRLIYTRKRNVGLSTCLIVKHLVNKCLFTGQLHTAEKLLSDTISMQDISNAKLVSKKLIHWYLLQKNIKQAINIWEEMEKNQYMMDQDVMEELLIQSAKLKYHVDVMKLYKRYNDLYPRNPQVSVYVLRCLSRSKEFKNASLVQDHVEHMLQDMKPNLARIAVTTLFSLSAQTGDIDLFERVFGKSEKLNLSLTHKGLTSLISCYLTRGDVQSAKLAFQKVALHTNGPDVVDFNLLMRTVVMEDEGVDHDKIFDILKHMEVVNVIPDETTMRTMSGFYKSESEMQNSLYQKLLNNPSSISRFNQVYLNNIAMASLLTRMDIAQVVGILMRNNRGEIFKSQQNQPIHVNGATYKMLLDAANKENRYSSISEKLLKDMDARGIKPTRDVYECLIRNVAHKGKIAKARRYIEKMENDTGEKANVKTYTKLVDGLLYLNKPHLAKLIITQDMVQNNIPYDDIVYERLKKIESLL